MATEQYFRKYRENTIGNETFFDGPYGPKRIYYADWTASGRMYRPIEERFLNDISPYVANTHTETNLTGSSMTMAYHKAKEIIKHHVNANEKDVLISSNSGMTGVVNKLQRILGLKIHEKYQKQLEIAPKDRPVIFVSHMEHHSNQTSWLETIADVVIIDACNEGLMDLECLKRLVSEYQDRTVMIAAITSCSNVTGIKTPYHEVARLMHQAGGLCFVDFACSAPYIDIDMHPSDPECALDAIYFSPHKFLGGPGSSGILVFNGELYNNRVPDNPGGGTVDWTNPWGEHKYFDQIEAREDGGTPSFLQTIRVALAIKLKEEMGVKNILAREKVMINNIFDALMPVENLHILADQHRDRLGVISFYIEDLHYNLAVKMLNDRFGVQVRGGCSCAGTYGHYLLEVSQETSKSITDMINVGDMTNKPGWVRFSIHPIMTDEEVSYICEAIKELAANHKTWIADYKYVANKNEFVHVRSNAKEECAPIDEWFEEAMA